jgi:hypothetical protein
MSGSIVPTPAYTDVRKAVGFLVDAFGFERHTVYEDDAGNLAHVELVLGTSMVMPAVPGRGEYGDLLTSVADAGRPTGGADHVAPEHPARSHHHGRHRICTSALSPTTKR